MTAALRLSDVISVLDELYDPAWAQSWDAVGLVAGDRDATVRRVVFAIDPVMPVIEEAVSLDADLLVTHHPLLLRPVHSVSSDQPKGRAVTALIRAGIALHVVHTNADVASPGVSDALAEAIGLGSCTALRPTSADALDKVITFVPTRDAERLIDALAEAGAGRLGDYARAAWTAEGTGTFTPLPGARPAIGSVGTPEQVIETRVEMVLPPSRRAAVVGALKAAHPYEEPAFDIIETVPPQGQRGIGRVGELSGAESLGALSERVAAALPRTVTGIRVAGDPDHPVRRVAVCGGAGDDLFDDVRASGVDAYVTADLRHHPASEAREYGAPALVDCSHWASEWPWLLDAERRLQEGVARHGTTVETHVSRIVTDPWTHIAMSPREDAAPPGHDPRRPR